MYVNKFMRKEASFDFLKTVKDTWNSLSPEHREAIRNAGIGFATGSVGNLLLGDSERTAGQKALDALLWGTGTGAAFYGAGRGYRYLKKYLQDRQNKKVETFSGLTPEQSRRAGQSAFANQLEDEQKKREQQRSLWTNPVVSEMNRLMEEASQK